MPPLPSFKNPPVVETVLGVEYAPIQGWGVPFLGLYWEVIREEFPRFEVQAPIGSQIESFDQQLQPSAPSVQLLPVPPDPRVLFIARDDQRLIQLQHNRFIFNWRQGDAPRPYPRYEEFVRPGFETEWARFLGFLKTQSFDLPSAAQCEVTYVNHLPQGDGWETIEDWRKVFTGFGNASRPQFLPGWESFKFDANFAMPEQRGRLHVSAQHAVRLSDQKQVIVFTLTARGKPESIDTAGVLKWFDLGREWVVRGFTDLTSDAMHKTWGRLS